MGLVAALYELDSYFNALEARTVAMETRRRNVLVAIQYHDTELRRNVIVKPTLPSSLPNWSPDQNGGGADTRGGIKKDDVRAHSVGIPFAGLHLPLMQTILGNILIRFSQGLLVRGLLSAVLLVIKMFKQVRRET